MLEKAFINHHFDGYCIYRLTVLRVAALNLLAFKQNRRPRDAGQMARSPTRMVRQHDTKGVNLWRISQ
jgi:hypothetical protein